MSVSVVPQSARLTSVEEQLFLRAQHRVRVYFQEFEELEGFSVLGANLQRLLVKVEFELRSTFLHHHDVACQAEQLQAQLDACMQELEKQRAECDQVIAAARKLAWSTPAVLEKRTNELQSFHAAEVKLREKQWTVQADKRLQDHVQVLSDKYARQLKILELEYAQRVEAVKEKLEAKNDAEIGYLRAQMRLQLTSQLDRETRDLLTASGRRQHRRKFNR
ncbi:Flagellar associated protein [Phytophthora cinnamomi]|uniref:Flagellar associated protein n=1 Tax=Phytophthora cinnamomi TaxID=4785 RepID=UPI00355A41A6|nr:Flagellar associated protein [Phytophthora cinnamomi]